LIAVTIDSLGVGSASVSPPPCGHVAEHDRAQRALLLAGQVRDRHAVAPRVHAAAGADRHAERARRFHAERARGAVRLDDAERGAVRVDHCIGQIRERQQVGRMERRDLGERQRAAVHRAVERRAVLHVADARARRVDRARAAGGAQHRPQATAPTHAALAVEVDVDRIAHGRMREAGLRRHVVDAEQVGTEPNVHVMPPWERRSRRW
jgi:hypothetical protein